MYMKTTTIFFIIILFLGCYNSNSNKSYEIQIDLDRINLLIDTFFKSIQNEPIKSEIKSIIIDLDKFYFSRTCTYAEISAGKRVWYDRPPGAIIYKNEIPCLIYSSLDPFIIERPVKEFKKLISINEEIPRLDESILRVYKVTDNKIEEIIDINAFHLKFTPTAPKYNPKE